MKNVFVHPTAIVDDGAEIGEGSYIWHFAHVRSGAKLGKKTIIGKSSYIDEHVVLGDGVKVQNLVSVYNGVSIGDNVFIGPHVAFTNDLLPRIGYDWEITETNVGNNVSIGANATIVCGSNLGDFCFIAAGTVIPANRNIPQNALIMGNPGRIRGWVCNCGRKLLDNVEEGRYNLHCDTCKKDMEMEVVAMTRQ